MQVSSLGEQGAVQRKRNMKTQPMPWTVLSAVSTLYSFEARMFSVARSESAVSRVKMAFAAALDLRASWILPVLRNSSILLISLGPICSRARRG